MKETTLPLPQLALIAATRGMLGAGIGLLAGEKLSPDARRAAGWALLAVGVASTIPLAMQVFGGRRESAPGQAAIERARAEAAKMPRAEQFDDDPLVPIGTS